MPDSTTTRNKPRPPYAHRGPYAQGQRAAVHAMLDDLDERGLLDVFDYHDGHLADIAATLSRLGFPHVAQTAASW